MESSPNVTIKFGKKDFVGKFEGVFLDSYDVIRQLGKGGYGKVYEVMNKKTREIRACKHLSKLSIKNLEKFKREVEILRIADHPNIIKLYEIFESRHSIYLIMEECRRSFRPYNRTHPKKRNVFRKRRCKYFKTNDLSSGILSQ